MLPFVVPVSGFPLIRVQVVDNHHVDAPTKDISRCFHMWDVRHRGQWDKRCQALKTIWWNSYELL